MSTLKCFLTNEVAPLECSRASCTDCALVVELLAGLEPPRPADLDVVVPEHVRRSARQVVEAGQHDAVAMGKPRIDPD